MRFWVLKGKKTKFESVNEDLKVFYFSCSNRNKDRIILQIIADYSVESVANP